MTRRVAALTVVTNSELQAFRDCQQKWQFAYVEGLRPKVAPRALGFGTAVHGGLRAGYALLGDALSKTTTPAIEDVAAAGAAECKRLQGAWFADVMQHGEMRNDEELETLANEAEQTIDTATWMVRHYFETFASDLQNLVPLGIEMPFELTLLDRAGHRLGHLRMAGVLDLVAYDRSAQDLVIFDHKTTAGEVQSIDRRVELDPQMAGYLWALREAIRRKAFDTKLLNLLDPVTYRAVLDGKVPTGRVVYNVLRKKRPRFPEVTQKGLVSAAAIDTLPEFYRQALDEQLHTRQQPWTEKQQEILARLEAKGDSFLSRREFYRSDEEVGRWRREVFLDASRIRLARADSGLVTRNAGHCTMPWSMPCVYRQVCLDPGAPELREQFRVAKVRHEEVAEAREAEEDTTPFQVPF